MICELI